MVKENGKIPTQFDNNTPIKITQRLIKPLPKWAAPAGFKSLIIDETKSTQTTKVLVPTKARKAHTSEKTHKKIILSQRFNRTNCSSRSK